jgi:hypothetical protein
LSRYAGRFCIRTSNPNFIAYLWLICYFGQWVLISRLFANFDFWRFLPRFACHSVLLSFLGIEWVVIFDCQFLCQSDHFVILSRIGMRAAFLTPDFYVRWSVLDLFCVVLIHPLHVDLRVDGAPIHEHVCMLLSGSCETRTPGCDRSELCSLGLGWESALPTGTHRWMSMGM